VVLVTLKVSLAIVLVMATYHWMEVSSLSAALSFKIEELIPP